MHLKPASVPTKPRTLGYPSLRPQSLWSPSRTTDNRFLFLQSPFPRATPVRPSCLRICSEVVLQTWSFSLCPKENKVRGKGPKPSKIKDAETQTKPWPRGNILGHVKRKPQVWSDRTKARQTSDINWRRLQGQGILGQWRDKVFLRTRGMETEKRKRCRRKNIYGRVRSVDRWESAVEM